MSHHIIILSQLDLLHGHTVITVSYDRSFIFIVIILFEGELLAVTSEYIISCM